jgi:hypothetical protein
MILTAHYDELRLSSFGALCAAKAHFFKIFSSSRLEGGFTMQAMFEG